MRTLVYTLAFATLLNTLSISALAMKDDKTSQDKKESDDDKKKKKNKSSSFNTLLKTISMKFPKRSKSNNDLNSDIKTINIEIKKEPPKEITEKTTLKLSDDCEELKKKIVEKINKIQKLNSSIITLRKNTAIKMEQSALISLFNDIETAKKSIGLFRSEKDDLEDKFEEKCQEKEIVISEELERKNSNSKIDEVVITLNDGINNLLLNCF